MRRIRNKLTNSNARGLSLCWKRSGKIPVVVTEGDRFFSAPELQTDGVDVAWSGVVNVDNACFDFLSKNISVVFVPAGRGLLRASWTFRHCEISMRERERGGCWSVWCACGFVLIRAVFFCKRDSLMRNDCVIRERELLCVYG